MFTGIIETLGKVTNLIQDGNNQNIIIQSNISTQLTIDQSVSHDGICLTVVDVTNDFHTVTAVKETMLKTNLRQLTIGTVMNLERAMKLGERLDGHLVQGHVDQTAVCTNVSEEKGSWYYHFKYDASLHNITIEKGSIAVNGVSLTVVDSKKNAFSVAIIPYTYEHTNFQHLKENSIVNLEFDMIGKYVSRMMNNSKTSK
jgi:riboflavin synthase